MFRDPTIAGDWTELTRRLDANGALTRWSGREPTLAGLSSVAELADLLAPSAGTDPDRSDALVGALVRTACLAGGDDADAVLVLAHLLADGLRAMATRLADLSDDVLALLVGELCAQIRAWPLRRTRAYAANLLRDTQRACWRELRPHRTRTYPRGGDVLIDPLDVHATCAILDRPVPGPGDADDGLDLSDMFAWARRHGIAEPRDLALLVALERHRGYGTGTRHRVAAAFGIHERTLRRRRDRALGALRAAAGRYLDDTTGDPGRDTNSDTEAAAA